MPDGGQKNEGPSTPKARPRLPPAIDVRFVPPKVSSPNHGWPGEDRLDGLSWHLDVRTRFGGDWRHSRGMRGLGASLGSYKEENNWQRLEINVLLGIQLLRKTDVDSLSVAGR